jgi:hypothetical protein
MRLLIVIKMPVTDNMGPWFVPYPHWIIPFLRTANDFVNLGEYYFDY